jgi:hypothetical protein
MARTKPDLSDIFATTEGTSPATGAPAPQVDSYTADNSDLDRGNIRPLGVGIREGEIKALKAIAASLGGLSVNALCHWAIRDFIKRYRAGEIDLADKVETPPIPKKRLRYD